MTEDQWLQIKALFEEALVASQGLARESLLNAAPSAVAQEVRRLLALHEDVGDFLSGAPAGAGNLRNFGATLQPGILLNGRFEILRFLGQGGMAEVYEALDRDLSQTVAIKIVSPGADGSRFTSEIRTARRVTHPNVCRIFDIERHENLVFCTMELLNGETLSARIGRGQLPQQELLAIAGQICAGLAAAHKAGIIHRDLKPANVILEPGPRAVITDFGLAQLIRTASSSPHQTRHHELIGTLPYMAPEVLSGQAATVRSDIYSLGILLYECATGQLPFESAGALASVVRRAFETATPPKSINPQVGRSLNDAILACLLPDPSKRPAAAQEVMQRIAARTVVNRRKLLKWATISAGSMSLLGIGYRFNLQRPKTTGTKAVLLASLQNSSGDPRFSGMATLLRNQLQQSPHFEVLAEARVRDILLRMQTAPNKPLDPLTAREVALRNGATLVVYANISRLGPDFILDVKIEEPGSRPDFFRQSWDKSYRAIGEQDLLSRARDAADWVRQVAGESVKEIDYQNRSPREITTFSWDALSLFNASRDKRNAGMPDQAEVLLKEALRIDPQFPSARRDLADLLISQRKFKEGYAAWQQAVDASRSRQLNSRERYRIEALYADDIVDLSKAESINKAWIANYPTDFLPHFLLGNVYFRQGRLAEASRQMSEANALQPEDVAVGSNLAQHYVAQEAFDKARRQIAKLRGFAPAELADEVDGKAHFVWGQPGESRQIFERLLRSSQSAASHRGALLLAATLAEQGRQTEAFTRLQSLLPEDEALGNWQWRAQKLVYLAELARALSRTREAIDYAAQALALDDGDLVQEQAGVLLARCNDLTGANRALAALRTLPRLPRTARCVARLSGEIALQRKDWPRALTLLRAAAAATTTWDWNDSLARGLEIAGAHREALAEFRKLAQAKAFIWYLTERSLPGSWSCFVSQLISLASSLRQTADVDRWSRQLLLVRQS